MHVVDRCLHFQGWQASQHLSQTRSVMPKIIAAQAFWGPGEMAVLGSSSTNVSQPAGEQQLGWDHLGKACALLWKQERRLL